MIFNSEASMIIVSHKKNSWFSATQNRLQCMMGSRATVKLTVWFVDRLGLRPTNNGSVLYN